MWLAGQEPTENTKDILGLLHTNGFLSERSYMSAIMWYDWSNDGKYHTKKENISTFQSESGAGIACDFPRQVTTPTYNLHCKNF